MRKMREILEEQDRLKRYNEIKAQLNELMFSHLDAHQPHSAEEIIAYLHAKHKCVCELESGIAKLDEE